jgi:alkylhydroperoxidase family enzyme
MDQLDPDLRAMLEGAVAAGILGSAVFSQIMAYNMGTLRAQLSLPGPGQMGGLLEPRLLELVRLRSAEVGGCGECVSARYGDTLTEEEAACAISGNDDNLSERERLALQYVTLMHTDHHRIGDDFYRQMAQVFGTAELVELGMYVSNCVGLHRLLHTWDLDGTTPPVVLYEPSHVVRPTVVTS